MFRQYLAAIGANPATLDPDQPNAVSNLFQSHPLEIAALVERHWAGRITPPPPQAPFPAIPLVTGAVGPNDNPFVGGALSNAHPHLIYAYMVENTRIYDIFRRVVSEFVQGERLEIPSWEGQRWVRTTEELFFRVQPSFLALTLTSDLRPDQSAMRRNAYYRMFGLDLNHGTDDNKPFAYAKPAAANREFIPTLELLLTEIWRGITNATNTSGSRDTDDEAIATLSRRLQDMLTVRRQNGNLSREEFWFTATMSWFHLTVENNFPIVRDLRGDATSPEERLRKIGERVGLPNHGKSQAFLLLADYLSLFLREVELGLYSDATTAPALYNPPARDNLIRIITQYSVATGRDLKARTVIAQVRPSGNGQPVAATARR
jgi:hypothetical protein